MAFYYLKSNLFIIFARQKRKPIRQTTNKTTNINNQ